MKNNIKIYLRIFLITTFYFFPSMNISQTIYRNIETVFPSPGTGPVFKSISDMEIVQDKLLVVDNFGSRIISYDLSSDAQMFKIIGRKGLGPGDLNLPTFISISHNNKIIVIDNIGFSLFDLNGKFLDKFRFFVPVTSFSCLNNHIYCLEANPSSKHLISVYDQKGKRKQEFGKKFIKTKGYPTDRFSPFFFERCLYDGKILSDDQHIYYLSNRFGKFFKYSADGKLLHEAEMHKFWGKYGEQVIYKNKKIFVNLDLPNRSKKGIPRFLFFTDAVLLNDSLYLLSTPNQFIEKSNTITITIINKNTFLKESTIQKELDSDMRVFSFAVKVSSNQKEFFLNYTNNEGTFIGKMLVKQ